MTLRPHVSSLARKHRALLALLATPDRDRSAVEPARLRALAAELPGALRELDSLPVAEVHARAGRSAPRTEVGA